jgi:hypothetical protein
MIRISHSVILNEAKYKQKTAKSYKNFAALCSSSTRVPVIEQNTLLIIGLRWGE